MSLVVKKATKEFCAKKGMRCPDKAIAALSKKIEDILSAAAARAKGNGRKTLKPEDL